MIIKWVNLSQICIMQVDPKTFYLLNGLYRSIQIWSKLNHTQLKLLKSMLSLSRIGKSYETLPPLDNNSLKLKQPITPASSIDAKKCHTLNRYKHEIRVNASV